MNPLEGLEADLVRIEETLAVADFVNEKSNRIIDVSDLLRGALASALSSLDHYVHRRVHDEFVATYAAGGVLTDKGSSLAVPLDIVPHLGSDATFAWVSAAVHRAYGHLSFQQPKKISQAVSLVKDSTALWEHIEKSSGEPGLRTELELFVNRRNQIVHESDRNPSDLTELWPIDEASVRRGNEVVSFVASGIESFLSAT